MVFLADVVHVIALRGPVAKFVPFATLHSGC